ncbi:MAG: TatD family hydrolase [Candidatus Eremiobacteraeota bacterium]|nr:TatD family hydrolase [Candidatus Eremiobacteraeota bacterium]
MHIDTHAHLQFKSFKKDRVQVIERAASQGVSVIVTVGINMGSSEQALKLSLEHGGIYGALGFHPHNAGEMAPGDLAALEAMARNEKVVAVGELGLDYHYHFSPPEVQAEVFREQLRLAHRVKKPLVIHSREASEETLAILREEKAEERGGVIHCFSDTMEYARRFLEMGFYLGFTGMIAYGNAGELRKVVAAVPEDRIVAETDCPYLDPSRGKRNEPSSIPLIVGKIAELRGKAPDEMASILRRNAMSLFSLKL